MTYLATYSILRYLHLSHEFLSLYFTVVFIFPLFHFGGISLTIFILSESDSSTALYFSAALDPPTFLAFSASAVSHFFFFSSAVATAAAAATSAASLSFLSFSAYLCLASSFSLFFLSCTTAFAARYLSWAASTSTSESEEGELFRGIVKKK